MSLRSKIENFIFGQGSSSGYYPPGGFLFLVKLANTNANDSSSNEYGFQEASGISRELQTEEVFEGGDNIPYKVPKSISNPNLVLKRGLMLEESELHQWCVDTIRGFNFQIETKVIQLDLLNHNMEVLRAWNFYDAYPVKYEVSGFNAEQNGFVVEQLEFCYRGFEVT